MQVFGLGWAGRLITAQMGPEVAMQLRPEAAVTDTTPQPEAGAYAISDLPRVFKERGFVPEGDLLRDLCNQGYKGPECGK